MSFHHKYSIAELEEMAPFERDIFVDLTADYIKQQEEEAKKKLSHG